MTLLAVAALCIDCGTQVGKGTTRCMKCHQARITVASAEARSARKQPALKPVAAPTSTLAEKPLCIDATAHHWLIPQGVAPVTGVCKRCGAERPGYSNALEDVLKKSIGAPRPGNVRSVVIQQVDAALTSFVAPKTRRTR